MKTRIIKCFLCCIYLAPTFQVFANKTPPQPKPSGVPPGLPIDGHIIQVLVIGIILGIYFLKRKKTNTQ